MLWSRQTVLRRDKYMSFVNDVIAVFEHDKTKFDLNREGH